MEAREKLDRSQDARRIEHVGRPAMAKARSGDEAPRPGTGGTRRQFRQIARLVARLEAAGDLEARSRRQLQAALEKGRKTKRPRQEVDRAVARVAKLIERLRLMARELETPVPPVPEPVASPAPVTPPQAAASRKPTASPKPAASSRKPRATRATGPAKAP
jgi:hypothetical protein